jgi:hypothetical protein
MYDISEELYRMAVGLLLDRINEQRYICEVIEFEYKEILCHLHISAVIYQQTSLYPEGEITAISDIIPVWWEFHTYNSEDVEILNTFSFNELRQYI